MDHKDDRAPQSRVADPADATANRECVFRHVERLARIGGWQRLSESGDLFWTDQVYAILERPVGEPLSSDVFLSHFPVDARASLQAALHGLTDQARPFDLELPLLTAGGAELFVRVQGQAEQADGVMTACFGVIQDITEQRRAAQRLRVSERMLAKANEMAAIGIWSVDLVTGAVSWSDQVFRIHDLDPGQPPSVEDAISYYAPEARPQLIQALERLQSEGVTYDLELPLVTASGRHIWVRAMGDLARDGDEPGQLYGVFQDITARKQAEQILRQKEQRWWLALIASNDGVWDWDLMTSEVYFSPTWKQLLGYEDHEIENHVSEWDSRLHPDDKERILAVVHAYLGGETGSYHCEHRLRHRDGSWRTHLGRGEVVAWNPDGVPTRFVGTQTDITEQVRLREELVQAKEVAEAGTRAKSEFLAVMSHEIRTPLNGVLGMAEILLASDLEGEYRECARAIYSSGDLLLQILNDVLDLAKIEAGKLSLRTESFDIRRTIQQVVDLLAGQARRKGLELACQFAAGVPRFVIGDPGRLSQVVINLIGNAIKFTDSGSVTCHVDGRRNEAGGVDLRVVVQDTGPGIPVAARSSIFGSFSQVDSSSTRRFGGTGLGLAICQQLVELMEGQLGVESEVEVGSAFWFEIPLLAAESPAEAQPAPREAFLARTGVHARVLVVEDNRVNQLVARKMLERLGCAVDVASNGCEGLQQAGDQLYDLIFMDCQMPEMDGFEATTAIRQLASHPHQRVPIIAVTANVLSKDQDRCAAVGMQGCITKPLNMRDLAAALERHAPRAADRS